MGLTYFLNLAVNGVVEGLGIALLALALTLVFGIARFPNASAGDVLTAGAYAGYGGQVLFGGSIILGAVSGMAAMAALSAALYVLVFRKLEGRSGVYPLVASIGLAFAIRSALTFFIGHDQRVFSVPLMRAIDIGPIRVVPTDLYIAATALAALLVVFAILHLTPLGRRMRAVADNPDLARTCGIGSGRVLLALWLLAGAVTGLGGVLLGIKTVVTPMMGWELLLPAFAATILGTIGNPLGAVIGAVLIGVAQELSTPFVGFTYKIGVGFAILLLVLLVRPQGIFAGAERVR